MVLLACKTEKRNRHCEHGQPMEQTRCLFCMRTQVWLAVNHNISVTSGEWIWCSKRIERASGLGSSQSKLCHSWGYERLQKSKKSLKACFENTNIVWLNCHICIILEKQYILLPPTKSDSDVIVCLQLLSETLTCTLHFCLRNSIDDCG